MRYRMSFAKEIEDDYRLYLSLGGKPDKLFEFNLLEYEGRSFVDKLSQYEYEDIIQEQMEVLCENLQAK